jgi:hypothetical protein
MLTEEEFIELSERFDAWMGTAPTAGERELVSWYGPRRENGISFLAYATGYVTGRNSARKEQMEKEA